MRGARVPGGRVARMFLGLFTVLDRLSLGPGPIGAFGLGRLARGTEPPPMVPTPSCYRKELEEYHFVYKFHIQAIFSNLFIRRATSGENSKLLPKSPKHRVISMTQQVEF